MLRGGTLLSMPALAWLAPLLYFPGYGLQVREARKRGYEWSTIRRVLTLPPRWWWLWWPRSWRRTGDVYEQLPASLKSARMSTGVITLLLLAEAPLMAWATDPRRLGIRDRVPAAHQYFSAQWLSRLDLLVPLVALTVFLLGLVLTAAVAERLAKRATKGTGVGYMDRRRLTYKATDSAFWRDPRIQRVYRQQAGDRRPKTPQEFVSQILAASGTFPPSASESGSNATAAARRLLDAMTAHERELALLEKTAPREQLERLEAEILLHESEAGDPEAVALLLNQRDALARSRERMVVVAARREEAAARLEALWASVRRLSASTDADAARAIAASISDTWRDVERDYPLRRTTSDTQRSTAGRAAMLVAVGGLFALQQAAAGDAGALLSRGQPDSALLVLDAQHDSSASALVLTGKAQLMLGTRAGIGSRYRAARAAQGAFTAALVRDVTRAEAMEALTWMARLLPSIAGGDRDGAVRMAARLAQQHPYRGALMRGHLARAGGREAVADSIFSTLVTTYPDSAPAWFARYDLAHRMNRADVARDALRRYMALAPTDRAALYQRGQLAATLGVELPEGEAALQEYLKGPFLPGYPPRGQSWWRLGQVLQKQGRLVMAREAYAKAVAIDRRDTDYRAALESLDAASERRK